MSDSNAKISVSDLHKSFGSNEVLRGVDLDVDRGKSLVVIGGSGLRQVSAGEMHSRADQGR